MKKKERDRFVKEATQIVVDLGGEVVRDIHRNGIDGELRSELKFGPLDYVAINTNHRSVGGPGHVCTRFTKNEDGKRVNCNPHSGKWNHYYFEPWTVDDALRDLRLQLSRLKEPTNE